MIKSTIITVVLAIVILFSAFVHDVRKPASLPEHLTCENIVVLTGGKNRIALAFDSVKRFHAKNILISGVYKSTTLQDIVGDKDFEDVNIILGYEALNTEGNAEEIRGFVQDMGITSIVLVTSDYHMRRSLYEVKKHNENLIIFPLKVVSTFNLKFLILSFKEFYYNLCILIRDSVKGIIND